MTKKSKALDNLEWLANHFEFRDWDYTRKHNLKEIRYENEYDKYNTLWHRIGRSIFWMFGRTPDFVKQLEGRGHTISERIRMAEYALKRDPNLPDGVLDGGSVITFWEETGEYLNLMQPTVGALLVTFLKEDPENPHAIKITKEIERLHRRYTKRIKDEEVSVEPKVK